MRGIPCPPNMQKVEKEHCFKVNSKQKQINYKITFLKCIRKLRSQSNQADWNLKTDLSKETRGKR